jgi:hypothetical protein
VRAGVDIVQTKRLAREGARAEAAVAAASTFKGCAERYTKDNEAKWSKKHAAQWPSSLKQYAYPTIGHLRIAEILPSHIFELLKPIWIVKREPSNRVHGRIETIIAKNVDINDNGFRNPAELTKQLREKLPKRPKRKPRHHPALPYAETPQFMPELAGAEGVIGNTRSEKDFARFLKALLNSAGPDTRWDIVCDNLNIHLSESVVRLVARHCGLKRSWVSKASPACSLSRRPAKHSCATRPTASSSTSPPSTPYGSTRSKSGSPSS